MYERFTRLFVVLFLAAAPGVSGLALGAQEFTQARQALVRQIAQDVRDTSAYLNKESLAPGVLDAIEEVPRHEFVPADVRTEAYLNRPLPIGYGQTISQPYIVAVMTDLVAPAAGDTVLEVGSGSGYQAAVLGRLVKRVYTMEIIEPLGRRAAATLERLGYSNVEVRISDGYYGWPEHGPYDAIVVTAAASHVPPPLISQLKPGGRMVIPVGSRFFTQQLVVVEKDRGGEITTTQVLPVRFVPLTGGH